MSTIEEALNPTCVTVMLDTGGTATVTTDARWAEKMRNATVSTFLRGGEWIMFIVRKPNGERPQSDKNGMSAPHYLTGKISQYHVHDNDPFNLTTSNLGSRHEKHTNKKHKQ